MEYSPALREGSGGSCAVIRSIAAAPIRLKPEAAQRLQLERSLLSWPRDCAIANGRRLQPAGRYEGKARRQTSRHRRPLPLDYDPASRRSRPGAAVGDSAKVTGVVSRR